MATAHIESKKEDIAKIVIMPGDPMRAKYIAEHYLTNVRLINDVRGMLGYTGFYNNKEITVFASGMGCPSIGIYAYELYKFYDVEKIIRIGTSGACRDDVNIFDVIIADSAYTLSVYPKLLFDDDNHEFSSSKNISDTLEESARTKNIPYKRGMIITSDVFDLYADRNKYFSNYPSNLNALALEMEAAALFAIAKHLNKEAGAVLTVVDSVYTDAVVSSDDRERSLDTMIKLVLDSI